MQGTFQIVRDSAGYWYLDDTAAFNNRGRLHSDEYGMPFDRATKARAYAQRCVDFKEGRRVTV